VKLTSICPAGVLYQNNQLTLIIIWNNVAVAASQNVAVTVDKQHSLFDTLTPALDSVFLSIYFGRRTCQVIFTIVFPV
jgi:hypothetical protein